jgi:CRISPR/Cas system-associated exonuclease Cas4 (RecB family)
MAALPELQNTTAAAIHELHARRVASETRRGYLGWSSLGEPCERRLWYGFRWAGQETIEGRLARLFDTGHREEARVIEELKALGYEVYDRDPATGNQFAVESHNGHLHGHLDLIVRGLPEAPKTWHLVDVKTIKAKKFDELLKKGMRAMYPKYWAQGMGYMGHQELERAAFIFVCKDDDRIHVERFEFDRAEFEQLEAKAKRVIEATSPPQRLSNDPAWFECRFCPFQEQCHWTRFPESNCRTCVHSTPTANAQWECASKKRTITLAQQRQGCEEHLFIPPMLDRIGEPIDGTDKSVTYKLADGRTLTNGQGGQSSHQLHMLGLENATAPELLAALAQFPGAKVSRVTA